MADRSAGSAQASLAASRVESSHLDHGFKRNRFRVRAYRKFSRIDGVDGRKQLRCLFRLIGLQMSDQMKPGIREIGNGRGFALHFLDVILAEIAQSQRIYFADFPSAEHLRHCQKRHQSGIAPHAGAGVFHPHPGSLASRAASEVPVTGLNRETKPDDSRFRIIQNTARPAERCLGEYIGCSAKNLNSRRNRSILKAGRNSSYSGELPIAGLMCRLTLLFCAALHFSAQPCLPDGSSAPADQPAVWIQFECVDDRAVDGRCRSW